MISRFRLGFCNFGELNSCFVLLPFGFSNLGFRVPFFFCLPPFDMYSDQAVAETRISKTLKNRLNGGSGDFSSRGKQQQVTRKRFDFCKLASMNSYFESPFGFVLKMITS